ncbi:MAG: competence/damage-inducible protein A [Ilumatobacteraceae bacterium]|jgi:nicotinamide-nucleotide amidase|nr:competence/damage-inducible protein A [Ilumatobacteraceae bacterium]MDP4735350.1 competence/damage-inducible protein A [Ilumatobacteraceae bacterium]
MRCSVVAVGTELLLGQIVDTNSSWLGEQLASAGIDSLFQVKVGDNLGRIVATLRSTLEQADAIIICGGLGPTHDDITREAIAEIMGVELEMNDEVALVIDQLFTSRGRRMPQNNLRQAMVPKGAKIIEQRRGTAPGLICPVGEKVMYAVPGVPFELYEMFERAILPDLLARSGEASVIKSRVLRTWGDSESGLNERLVGVINELEKVGNPTLAFLASGWEGIKVRLTAKANTESQAIELLDIWDAKVREQVEDLVFGVDGQNMESVVLQNLRERKLTLGIAESVTGGLMAGRLTAIAGASDVFRGAIVSYDSEVKFELLSVSRGPVVSESAAKEMAVGVRKTLGSDIGLAVTGVAGPTEQDGVKVGTLCVGLAMPNGDVRSTTFSLPYGREQMRQFSVISALNFLRQSL